MALTKGKRWLVGGALLALTAFVCFLWPPFTIVSLKDVREAERVEAFDPESYARDLWTSNLPLLQDKAPEVAVLLGALAKDPKAAAARYGNVWGLGGGTYFMVRGSGRVTRLHKDKIEMALAEGGTVDLLTGRLFGNTVRNACGLIDPSKFPNSQDPNKLSIALNRIVEEEVLAPLREEAEEGKTLLFCGATQILDLKNPGTLEIVPVFVARASGDAETTR